MKAKNMAILEKAMALWDKYSEEYREIVGQYKRLLEKKRNLGLKLNKINDCELKEFPEIDFLKIVEEDEAIDFLLDMSQEDMKLLILELEDEYIEAKTRYDLLAKIYDYKYEIRMEKLRKNYDGKLSMNPDRCGCGRKTAFPPLKF